MTAEGEEVLRVTAGSAGVALGPVALWRSDAPSRVPRRPGRGAEEECARLDRAVEAARVQLGEIVARIGAEVGEAEARLFKSHLALLEDPMVVGRVREGIRGSALSAEEALDAALTALVARFETLKDPRLRERAADIRDVGQRLLHCLAGGRPAASRIRPGSVVCAEAITPSEVSLLAPAAAALVLAEGSTTAHGVILARGMGLPVVLAAGSVLERVCEGDPVLVDGAEGIVVLHPAPATTERYRARPREADRPSASRRAPAVTVDGYRVRVVANVAGLEDATGARTAGADGVGLVRTEFLFLGRDTVPSEDEQTAAYRGVLERTRPLPVVFRVFDAGADKPLRGLPLPPEANPSLGLRGIRVWRRHEDLFRNHVRALLRASGEGDLAVLLPMVSDLGELRWARGILEDVRRSLAPAGRPVAVTLGVMVETPAAALIAAELAREADFLSIGTNDLVQYVLAVDRQGEAMGALYQPFHPAVLRLLRQVSDGAATHGRPITVCGEMAADPLAVPLLVGLGIGTLSVAPSAVTAIKDVIRGLSRSDAQGLAEEALALATAAEVVASLRRFTGDEGRSFVRADSHHR